MTIHFRQFVTSGLAAALAVPLGFFASQAAFGEANDARVLPNEAMVGADTPVPVSLGESVDGQARFDAATPLSECPELLEFLMSPEVVELQRDFGEPFTPDTRFGGGCPELGLMKERYEAALTRLTGGQR